MPGKFKTTIKGYSISEVNSFVDKVTAEYEALLEKLKVSDEENKKLKLELEKYSNIETSLKNALVIADETNRNLRKLTTDESSQILEDAKKNASRIVNDALIKADKIEAEAENLKRNVDIYKRRMKQMLSEQLEVVDKITDIIFFTGSYSNTVFLDPLSREEEEKYIKLLEENDTNARNKLIEHNLRLVAHIVKKFDNNINDSDDLISIGTIGLIKGIDSYKSNKNIRLTTYVARCIENEILMYYRSIKKYQNTVSLNDSIGYDKDGNKIMLIDVLKDNHKSLEESLALKENINLINKYLGKLNSREQEIIIKRYGLNNKKAMTQKEIAKNMHISRSYVSRIEKRAISKILKEFIKNKKIN